MRWMLFAARIFVVTGVIFGLLQGLLHGSTVFGLIAGVLFGLAMSVAITAITAARTRGRPGSLSTKHQTSVYSSLPPSLVHDQVRDVMAQMQAKITHDSPTRVAGRTKISWMSWGEVLSADIDPVDVGCELRVGSRPWFRATVADYGRNRDNVARMLELLQEATPA